MVRVYGRCGHRGYTWARLHSLSCLVLTFTQLTLVHTIWSELNSSSRTAALTAGRIGIHVLKTNRALTVPILLSQSKRMTPDTWRWRARPMNAPCIARSNQFQFSACAVNKPLYVSSITRCKATSSSLIPKPVHSFCITKHKRTSKCVKSDPIWPVVYAWKTLHMAWFQ